MSDNIRRMFRDSGYDATSYTRRLAANSDGERDLLHARQKILSLGEQTSSELKLNVFRHYELFINSARTVDQLKGELDTVQGLLMDQRGLMVSLMEASKETGPSVARESDRVRAASAEEVGRQRELAEVMRDMEGSGRLPEPGFPRSLVHKDDLVELDQDSMQEIRLVHVVLLSDLLLVATKLPGHHEPAYSLQTCYSLENLCFINVKDREFAFKVMDYPSTHLFQAANNANKKVWRESIEQSKRALVVRVRRESVIPFAREASIDPDLVDTNPFALDSDDKEYKQSLECIADPLEGDWIRELPERLDVAIAQRDTAHAVALVEAADGYVREIPDSRGRNAIERSVAARRDQLVGLLRDGVGTRGGPRAGFPAVLAMLGLRRGALAAQLLLRSHSRSVRHSLRLIRHESSDPQDYSRKLSRVFFTFLADSLSNYKRLFLDDVSANAAFYVWCTDELGEFIARFARAALGGRCDLATTARCVGIVRSFADTFVGLDLGSSLAALLAPHIADSLARYRDQLTRGVRSRLAAENWRPSVFDTPVAMETCTSELVDFGISEFFRLSPTRLKLPPGILSVSKSVATFTSDGLQLVDSVTFNLLADSLPSVIGAITDDILSNRVPDDQQAVIDASLLFLVNSLIPSLCSRFVTAGFCNPADCFLSVSSLIESRLSGRTPSSNRRSSNSRESQPHSQPTGPADQTIML